MDMIKLHQAKLSDTFDVLHVLNSALDKKRTYGDDSWGADRFTASEILPYIEAGELYMVLASGDVTGVVVLQESDENMWDADGLDDRALYIHKLSATEKGLGSKIIAAAELIARKKHKICLRLDCSYDNERLHGYYIGQGFYDVRRRDKDQHTIAFMQKDIG